jgi:hypothetical protein
MVLRLAVARNNLSEVRFALELKRAKINCSDSKQKYTPLHIAVKENRVEIIQYLISKGADLTIKDANGKTPIDYIRQKHKELIACISHFTKHSPEGAILEPPKPKKSLINSSCSLWQTSEDYRLKNYSTEECIISI